MPRRALVSTSDFPNTALRSQDTLAVGGSSASGATLSFWRYAEPNSNTDGQIFWTIKSGVYKIQSVKGASSLAYQFKVSGGMLATTDATTLASDRSWDHIVIRFLPSGYSNDAEIYINGVLDVTDTFSVGEDLYEPNYHSLLGQVRSTQTNTYAGWRGRVFDFCLLEGAHDVSELNRDPVTGNWKNLSPSAESALFYRLDGQNELAPGEDSSGNGRNFVVESNGVTTDAVDIPPGADVKTTPWKSPTGANSADPGEWGQIYGGPWTAANIATAGDDLKADNLIGSSEGLLSTPAWAYGFGFDADVPAGSVITGIEVRHMGNPAPSNSRQMRGNTLQLIQDGATGTPVGTNQSTSTILGFEGVGGSTWVEEGGESNLFGTSLTYAQVRSPDFGARWVWERYHGGGATNTATLRVDAVQMRVHYVEGNTIPLTGVQSPPQLGSSAVTTGTSLAPTGLVSAGEIGQGGVTLPVLFTPLGLTATARIDTADLTASARLSPTGLAATPQLGAPGVSAGTTGSPAGLSAGSTLSSPAVMSAVPMVPAGLMAASEVSAPVVATGTNVTPSGLLVLSQLDTPGLSSVISVAPIGLGAQTSISIPAVTALPQVSPDALQAQPVLGVSALTTGKSLSAVGMVVTGRLSRATLHQVVRLQSLGLRAGSSISAPTLHAGKRVIGRGLVGASLVSTGELWVTTQLSAPPLEAGAVLALARVYTAYIVLPPQERVFTLSKEARIIFMPQETRIIASENHMQKWPHKDPSDVLDYAIDWTNQLEGDTITTSEWAVPAGLVLDSTDREAQKTLAWISGGTAGVEYRITARITTAAGRHFERSAALRVVSR